jgi:hypothetical protein
MLTRRSLKVLVIVLYLSLGIVIGAGKGPVRWVSVVLAIGLFLVVLEVGERVVEREFNADHERGPFPG